MKSLTRLLYFLLFSFPVLAVASDGMPLEPYPPGSLAEVGDSQDVGDLSVAELRSIAQQGEYFRQQEAVKELVSRADDATIARLVYAMRRGNDPAQDILLSNPTQEMIPYLLEDMANGGLEPHGIYGRRVRVVATHIVSQALAATPGLPQNSRDWLKEIGSGSGEYPRIPEISEALLEWWKLNGEALMTGKPENAGLLPENLEVDQRTFDGWYRRREAAHVPLPPPPPPPIMPDSQEALPIHVAEPFEEWAARVRDPSKRDLRYALVDFETGRSIMPEPGEMTPSYSPDKLGNKGMKQSGSQSHEPTGEKTSSADDAPNLPTTNHFLIVGVIIIAIAFLLLLLQMHRSK